MTLDSWTHCLGSSESPLPVQEEAASETVTPSPHNQTDGHVKECLDAVPEAVVDCADSASGRAANPDSCNMDQ